MRTGASGGAMQMASQSNENRAALLRTVLGARPDSRLFRAEFQYLPLRDSPNDNPHVELALQPGELLLVHGPMDEDKFYWGETLDGRAGLVPSNFVQRVQDNELRELLRLQCAPLPPSSSRPQPQHCPGVPSTSSAVFAQSSSSAQDSLTRPPSPSFALAVPQHLAQISHDFSDSSNQFGAPQKALPDSVCPYPPADVSRITVQEIKHPDQPKVPWPRELQVERRLSRSLLLSWLPPESGGLHQPISQYQVCVNGQVRAVVPGSFKCRALLEDLELDKSVNISIRAVGADGLVSLDAACTLAVGMEASVAPQHVRVSQITPTSAQLSWLPSNSSAEHVVLLNALKVGICPPTVFQVQLNGLTPSTIYRLSVRTKHPRAVLEKRPVERCVDFKTLPKIGLPDPPTDVQAESGPQPGTLLVSWRPNSSQPRPPSRAAVHGYLIYADGRCIAQVPGSTADHVLLRLADFADDPPVFLTVRTRTRQEGTMSADSNVVRVPRNGASGTAAPIAPFKEDPQQMLLSSSLPSHLLGRLISSNGPSPPSKAPGQTALQSQQQELLLMPAIPMPPPIPLQNGPITRWGAPESMGPSGPRQHFGAPSSLQQSTHQEQYFTFHPKALDKEFPRLDERPDVLAMEQNYLLRHQQRHQRIRSATPDRRSFPMGAAKTRQLTAAPAILPGGPFPANFQGATRPPVVPQLARLQQDPRHQFMPGSTRSEPDLRPSRAPGMEESRWFVAIQDHQPIGMAASEELAFRRHQLVKVYGDVDGNGCFSAEVRGRYGLVPAGKLVEIAKDDLFLAAEQRRQMPPPSAPTMAPTGPSSTLRRMRWGSIKSRSYEHATESGQHRRQRAAFLGGSDQEGGGGGAIEAGEPFWGGGESRRQGMGRATERRMSAVEGGGGGSGYRLPTINGARMAWRGEEEMGHGQMELMERQQRNAGGGMEEFGVEGDAGEEMGESGGEFPQSTLRGLSQLMVAKYDYDSRQLSPNVDAEQVELSFRNGDMITVYGPMDDDGFYLGELNGVRGLVPSNFLQPASQPPDTLPARQKGVAFSSDLALSNHVGPSAPPAPWASQNSTMTPKTSATTGRRGTSQPPTAEPRQAAAGGSAAATARLTGATGMTSKAFKMTALGGPSAPGKSLTKKSSDLSARTLQQQPAGRKGSQAQGKAPATGGALKRKG